MGITMVEPHIPNQTLESNFIVGVAPVADVPSDDLRIEFLDNVARREVEQLLNLPHVILEGVSQENNGTDPSVVSCIVDSPLESRRQELDHLFIAEKSLQAEPIALWVPYQ